jgi:hypothetical protein
MKKAVAIWLLAAAGTATAAGNLLPLKRGIYLPEGSQCDGTSGAEMVTYWGGRSGIGAAQAKCTIKSVARKGNVYTIRQTCPSGGKIEGGSTTITITSPASFDMGSESYKYCGPGAQF